VSDYHKDVNPANERTPGRPPVLIKALNEWLERFCADRGYTYLNYFAAVKDENGQLQADLSDDGLHPNSKCYRIMAPLAMQAVQKTVGGPPPEPSESKPRKRRRASN
jgi:lysophospholipase L1-like esterase